MIPTIAIVVRADDQQWEVFQKKIHLTTTRLHRVQAGMAIPEAEAYFDLQFEQEKPIFNDIQNQPVFVNAIIAVPVPLPDNFIAFNGWNTFLHKETWELAASKTQADSWVLPLFGKLNWKFLLAPNTPGMIAARVVAMIINEAYFALGDGISTKREMDIAMKLGTNYPFGPFEWAEKIGLINIYHLLKKLCEEDLRYAVAPALANEIEKTE